METKNIDNNKRMSSDERFIATAREYAAALLDITNHFVELAHHFGNLVWGVETQARNGSTNRDLWSSLHVFMEVAGDHEHTYRQINLYSYDHGNGYGYDGYALCAKVEDFIDDFTKEYQDRLN